jgi:selenocysteine lyase/cysteine desulfurase
MGTETAPQPQAVGLSPREFRGHFPIFEKKVHLATNSKGALSHEVIAAHEEYLASWRDHGSPWDQWVGRHEQLRASFAELINADPGEVAVCFAASQALGVLASCLDFEHRPGVVFDDFAFPSVAQLWHAQAQRGADVRRVSPSDEDLIEPAAFDGVLDESVQLVSVAHGCYKNGHRLDLEAVAEKAHAVDALFVVDDYQVCGTRVLDVHATRIDVLVTGTLKFMLGSPGVAFMYVREDCLDRLHPSLTGWFGQQPTGALHIDRHDEAPDATRFQNGTAAIPSIYDSYAGLELLKSVGASAIEQYVDSLTALVMSRLEDAGFVPATPRDPARRAAVVAIKTNDMEAAVEELARRDIVVSSRDGNIRTAWHYYNTPEDVDVLIGTLEELGDLMLRA